MGIGMMPDMLGDPSMLPDDVGLATPEAAAVDAEAERQRQAEDEAQRVKLIKAMYGDDCPLANPEMTAADPDSAWVAWANHLWVKHRAGVQDALWYSERNRLFYNDIQWISANGYRGQWREPPMPKDAVRAVKNIIRPSINWAIQVMAEQRPGWRFTPSTNDPDRQRKAQAMQVGVEYQYHRQRMREVLREAAFWAKQDGCSFLLTYWDPDEGPWDDIEQGPLGDGCTKVYRIEQVRVSAEATATKRPLYWVLRDVIPLMQAVHLYGPEVADEGDAQFINEQTTTFDWQQYTTAPLYTDQKTVDRLTVFCEKSAVLPDGLSVITVGNKVVYGPGPLLIDRAPVVRMTDGNPDPNFFPMAAMNEIVAPQMRINMLLSKWIESVRKNSGGRFIAQSGSLVTETFTGGQASVIEVRTTGNVSDAIQPINGFSVGDDVKELLDREMKDIEDRTGWNDTARGQFTSDQSGRAILAIREQLERTFAPFVGAISEGMTEWAKQQVGWMKWGYQVPRMLGVTGQNRPDLAREFSAPDFDGTVDVQVDPETLMPMPRSLRLWLLKDAMEMGAMDIREYRRRLPFADFNDMATPDDVQEAKAKRVVEQIKNGEPVEPVLWQDDENINQTVLEREIILAADVDPMVLQMALMRWQQLADQAAFKMTPMMPPGEGPGGGGEGLSMPPDQQPTFGSSPGVAAAPAAMREGAPPAGADAPAF